MIWILAGGVVAGLVVIALLLAIVARTPSSGGRALGDSSGGDGPWSGGDTGGGHCHGGDSGGSDCGGGDGGGH